MRTLFSSHKKQSKSGYFFGLSIFLLAVAGTPVAIQAHPHVFIEAKSQPVINNKGQVTAITIDWQFDEYYTATAIQGLDTNKNGKYEPKELKALAGENIKALTAYHYLTKVTANGKKVKTGTVKIFRSEHKKGLLHLIFTLPLVTPVNIRQTDLKYLMYDPSFYISVSPTQKAAVTLPQALQKNCHFIVKKSQAETEGDVDIKKLVKRMASPEGLGKQYAQPVIISCKRKIAAK